MSRILTGVQSSGVPHLGNILGAIKPAINLSNDHLNESLFFIANMHSLTTMRDAAILKNNTYSVAAAWIAFGFDVNKHVFYRQSDVPEVCELAWYLSCLTPYPMLANAHSFKDKSDRLQDINVGLFSYPVLMAADILLYNADIVPVGKDQVQHLEITRDIADKFNYTYGETFVIPVAKVDKNIMTIPGIDGQKMSKSYNNFIDIFLDEKALKKVVMSIVTDSTPLEEPKNPDTCNVFKLYSYVCNEAELVEMRAKYLSRNYGYGNAKTALFEKLLVVFSKERKIYHELMSDVKVLEDYLTKGAQKAREIANTTLQKVRLAVGM